MLVKLGMNIKPEVCTSQLPVSDISSMIVTHASVLGTMPVPFVYDHKCHVMKDHQEIRSIKVTVQET